MKSPLATAFAGLGIGIVAMLYWLGVTVKDDEDEYAELDDTQQLPLMPTFDKLDDAIAWHSSQIQKYEAIKKQKLDQVGLVERLEAAVSDIEYLRNELKELKGEDHENV